MPEAQLIPRSREILAAVPYFERWINTDWQFLRIEGDAPCFDEPNIDEGQWDEVSLPHSASIEAYNESTPWQGICWYRRHLNVSPEWFGKRVSIQFGAAMQIAEVWVNGKLHAHHLGGYLPFTIDVTREVACSESIVVAIRLDNRDTDRVPPGKPTAGLDFNYSGGLYRGVKLIVTNPVHVTDSLEANIVAGGGTFVTYSDVSETSAIVHVKTDVANDGDDIARRCRVRVELLDCMEQIVAEATSEPVLIVSAGHHEFKQAITVFNPRLWHPDEPNLYTLRTTVSVDGHAVDEVRTTVGIRTFSLDKRLTINGKEFHIQGSNRHQEYPYIEYGLSPNAAWRDAQLIKDGGFNHIRLSHYPQDSAFLDACDHLGILVQAAIPGWQQFHDNDEFVSSSYQNIRDLIRRDRNHPSIVFWEPNLNETHGDHQDWLETAYEIAHQEYPGDECFTFGDPYPDSWRGWDVKEFVREYGDYGFGGNESTSRHTRDEGEAALLQQAWNFQWCHNDNWHRWQDQDAEFLGDATWCMFDYNRGYYHKPCTSGMMDIFRLPKYVYRFFQSQRDPSIHREDIESGPMVWIASDWTERSSPTKLIVYSNCEEVTVTVNGTPLARQTPDSGPDSKYSDWDADLAATIGQRYDATGGYPFDGGNARHLDHAPFTFVDVPYSPGIVEAEGFIRGNRVVSHVVRTAEEPKGLKLEFDTQHVELTADGADTVFVRARIVDKHGTTCPVNAWPSLQFRISGSGRLIGLDPAHVEAGVASVLLQAGTESGPITVTVSADNLSGESVSSSSTIISYRPFMETSRTPIAREVSR